MGSIEIFKDIKLIENCRIFLNECRKLNKFTDLTLKSNDGQEISVHKAILWSASTYFQTMFNSNLKECRQDSIQLKNDITKEDLEVIVEYLYTGEAKIPKNRSKIIFEKANYYQLMELQQFCSQLLIQEIDDANCLEFLRYAELFSDNDLKRGSIKYLAINGDRLLERYLSEFSNDEFQAILTDTELKIFPEKMFTCIMNWIKLDLPNRSKYIEKLLKNVDLLEISDDFMDVELQLDDTLHNSKVFSHTLMKMIGKSFRELKSWNNIVNNENQENITVVVNRESPSIALSDALDMVNNILATNNQRNEPVAPQLPETNREPVMETIQPSRPTRESRQLRRLSTGSPYQTVRDQQTSSRTSLKDDNLLESIKLPIKDQKRIFIAYHYSIEKLNLENKIWEQQFILKNDKFNYAIASNNNNIYLTGGLTPKSEPSSAVYLYNAEIARMKRIPSMLEGRQFHKSICINEKIYSCGGETNRGSVEYFDIGREIWIKGPKMNKARNCFGLSSNCDNSIYAVGGTMEQTIEYYDQRQGDWNIIGKLPKNTNYRCKSFCTNNLLYCIDPTSNGFIYDLRAMKLKQEIIPSDDIVNKAVPWLRYDIIGLDGKVFGIFRNQFYQYSEYVWKNLRPSYLKHRIESVNLCTL